MLEIPKYYDSGNTFLPGEVQGPQRCWWVSKKGDNPKRQRKTEAEQYPVNYENIQKNFCCTKVWCLRSQNNIKDLSTSVTTHE